MVGLDVYVGPRVGAAALASTPYFPVNTSKFDATRHLLPALPALILDFATTLVHALGDPNSPVCGQDEVKLFLGFGVHPAADSTLARKCESVFAVDVDNGEFHIGVERSGIYWLPVHNEFIHPQTDQLRHLRQPRETARLEKGTVAPFSWFLGFRRCHPAIRFAVVGA